MSPEAAPSAKSTPLRKWHEDRGGKMVDFAGWSLPVQYETGIVKEHLTCRKYGCFFDISHMGRFMITGPEAVSFLNSVLTNNAAKLTPGRAQYTILANRAGGAVDDAYLYSFDPGEYLLVVNAANTDGDWDRLSQHLTGGVELIDVGDKLAMLAVQGPAGRVLMETLLGSPPPGPGRNRCGRYRVEGHNLLVASTGYTGEPTSYELFVPWDEATSIWARLIRLGAESGLIPAGLGARDTLRLEAGLPLYGHELTADRPIMSLPQAKFAVDLSDDRGDFIGRAALKAQKAELDQGRTELVPQLIRPVAAIGRAMIRDGAEVRQGERIVGRLTSATMVPGWIFDADDRPGPDHLLRGLGLALIDRDLEPEAEVEILYRRKSVLGRIVTGHVTITPPYVRPLVAGDYPKGD